MFSRERGKEGRERKREESEWVLSGYQGEREWARDWTNEVGLAMSVRNWKRRRQATMKFSGKKGGAL
jgi:hypothetical protein